MNHWVPARMIWQITHDFLEVILKDSWFADHPIAKNCVCSCLFFLECLGPNAINHQFTILASCHGLIKDCKNELWARVIHGSNIPLHLCTWSGLPLMMDMSSWLDSSAHRSCISRIPPVRVILQEASSISCISSTFQQPHMIWVWLLPILEEGTSRGKRVSWQYRILFIV